MGFTFSFPMIQEGLNKGILVKWTKGFNATNVVGKDVVQLLIEAFNRRKVYLLILIFRLIPNIKIHIYTNINFCDSYIKH